MNRTQNGIRKELLFTMSQCSKMFEICEQQFTCGELFMAPRDDPVRRAVNADGQSAATRFEAW